MENKCKSMLSSRKQNNMEKQVSESFLVAVLLAGVGGFLDAYTYVCRDQVFANAQTGNIVRVGMAIAYGDYFKTVRYLIPIMAFCLGVMLTIFIRSYKQNKLHWRQIILFIEIMIIAIVGWIPVGKYNICVNTMISFICAMQAECFRKVLGKPFSSTMCTGNLRSGVEYFYMAMNHHDENEMKKCIQYCLIIFVFICGASLGVRITCCLQEKAILICMIPLIIAFCFMFQKK